MYSKNEIATLKKEFWTSFGQYMRPVKNAEGEFINWINYKTGIKHIFFRMDAVRDNASIGIEITHAVREQRLAVYEQFLLFKNLLAKEMNEEWIWQEDFIDEFQKHISRISISLHGVNILHRHDWPLIISFLKPRIIALDAFWSLIKDQFE